MRFARLIAGDHSVIVSADLHRDETAPHIHILMVPVSDDGRLGWSRVQAEAMVRLGAGEEFKYGQVYSSLQDAYYDPVSRHFGLGRGEERRGARRSTSGPTAKAQATKEGYARDRLRQQEEDLQAQREAAKFEVGAARREKPRGSRD